jgi:hypothetical protein
MPLSCLWLLILSYHQLDSLQKVHGAGRFVNGEVAVIDRRMRPDFLVGQGRMGSACFRTHAGIGSAQHGFATPANPSYGVEVSEMDDGEKKPSSEEDGS